MPIDGQTEFDSFTEAFEEVAVIITRRGAQGTTWPLTEFFHDKTQESIDVIFDWLDPLVRNALRRKTASSGSDATDGVFLDFLASSTDDVEHIRYELVTYLIASRDTTSSLITFTLYLLSMNEDILGRLRAEIDDHIGSSELPTYASIKALKYLRAVLNETLRLFPSAPLITRMSKGIPLVIPTASDKALYLPPSTQVMTLSLLLQRRHDLWGANADEFKPDRWLDDENTNILNSNMFIYCPFSHGPRACIGQDFAINEASYFLVRALQRFKTFHLSPQSQPVGSLPPDEWKHGHGRQPKEKIRPGMSFTMEGCGCFLK
ncbi:cytochrome P450 [Stereum hirsutum FP-91666 SS1]|uniref:cytochrome P450 n=1 Tax=Stereum hirsutum (strain FP-91666) TaxID=721885 RepID=UPI000444A85F|nr:cytochrome P450 [Stereum hirsutum FP-91666 SS1]EIM84245.1 cytochrome P450 [Stereum hirsutum FP-91666 SS1]